MGCTTSTDLMHQLNGHGSSATSNKKQDSTGLNNDQPRQEQPDLLIISDGNTVDSSSSALISNNIGQNESNSPTSSSSSFFSSNHSYSDNREESMAKQYRKTIVNTPTSNTSYILNNGSDNNLIRTIINETNDEDNSDELSGREINESSNKFNNDDNQIEVQSESSSSNNQTIKMAEEEVDIDLNDPEVGKAAVKIQAGFKNFMAKKKPAAAQADDEGSAGGPDDKGQPSAPADSGSADKSKPIDEALADIDLNDPDLEKAATKIQSSFRDYKDRKETSMKNT